jgi:hypothetical protein
MSWFAVFDRYDFISIVFVENPNVTVAEYQSQLRRWPSHFTRQVIYPTENEMMKKGIACHDRTWKQEKYI